MKRQIAFAALAAAALAACAQERHITGPAALSADALAAKLSCPSSGTPAPGSQVQSGLEVNGTCILDGVTVNGGITVDSGGHLQVLSSTVTGGISVLQCGELDVLNLANPTSTTSTINGDIVIKASATCTLPAFSDVDIWTARINGALSITGSYPTFITPTICNNEITRDLAIDNVTTAAPRQFLIGDPDGPLGCPGNTIGGVLSVSNSSVFEVESNSVGGSVLLSGSRLQVNGNTIAGSLLCSKGTVILPGEASDPSGNTVRGANSC